GLAEHHFVRGHAALAAGHAGDVDLDSAPASVRELCRAAREPRGAEVLHRNDAGLPRELEARLEQALLEKRVSHLHRRAPLFAGLVELDACERRAVDAV